MTSPVQRERAYLCPQTQQEEAIQLDGFATSKALDDTSLFGPPNTTEDEHLLHKLCQTFPTNKDVIQTALMLDNIKGDIGRPISLPLVMGKDTRVGIHVNFKVAMSFNRKLYSGSLSRQPKQKLQKLKTILPLKAKAKFQSKQKRKLDFKYPINIAINNGASADVIQILASAAPDILIQPEDIRNTNSLLIALQKQPKNHSLIKVLLRYAPQLAAIKDHHGNTPLHWAIQRGPCCSLVSIKALYFANPKAVVAENFHGETPLMLAQRKTLVPEDVVSFLRRTTTQYICSLLEAKEIANRRVPFCWEH